MHSGQAWGTLSIKPNFELMQKLHLNLHRRIRINKVHKRWYASFSPFSLLFPSPKPSQEFFLLSIVTSTVIPSTMFQAITSDEILHISKNGGNCLGIQASDAPLLIYSFTIRFSSTEAGGEDRLVEEAGKRIVDRSIVVAKEMGLYHPSIYLNYADVSQDVFAGYGDANRRKLREIQQKWDPEGVFGRRLDPGGGGVSKSERGI
jgi:hypothetical protein